MENIEEAENHTAIWKIAKRLKGKSQNFSPLKIKKKDAFAYATKNKIELLADALEDQFSENIGGDKKPKI